MEEKVEKSSGKRIALALLISFLICVAGAVLCGVIYYVGFISWWVALLTAYVAFLIFQKFYKVNWVSLIWVLIWTIILEELAIYLAIGISVAAANGVGVGEALSAFTQILSENADLQSAFLRDSLLIVVFAIFGVLLYYVTIKIKMKKAKKLAEQQTDTTNIIQSAKPKQQNEVTYKSVSNTTNDVYKSDFNAIIKGIMSALNTNDKTSFAGKLKQTYDAYILHASNDEIAYFRNRAETLLQKPDLSETQKKVLTIFVEKML